jgi:spore coat polysaccharide biosynthesis protein SpsF
MKIGVIIQARMGSTRLPGKVMLKIRDKTVLGHVIERVKQSKLIDEVIIATTNDKNDDIIVEESLKYGVKFFRGDESDVLSRYYYAAKENNLDVIVRITSDCPLIDSKVIDEIVDFYLNSKYDIVSNAGSNLSNRTYPRGLDVEVFSFNVLEYANNNAKLTHQKEHVTPYIYENNNAFYYKNNVDYSIYRWTLDTNEDFKLISKIYDHLFKGLHNFYLNDIVKLFEKMPELYQINSQVEQKKL